MDKKSEIYRSETRFSKIPSCVINREFLKKIFGFLYTANEEATKYAIDEIKRENFKSDEDHLNFIKLVRDSYKLAVIISGEDGELFASNDSSIFDDINLPERIEKVNFSNVFYYKVRLNVEPIYKLEILFDFAKPKIFDISVKPSDETMNLSSINVSGVNKTWVRGTYDNIIALLKNRRTKAGWLHKKNIYDIFLWFGIIPITFYQLHKFNHSILSKLSSLTLVLQVGIFIYLFLLITFLFMFFFKYGRWLYPYMELKSDISKGATKHRLIFYTIFVSIIASVLYDFLKYLLK